MDLGRFVSPKRVEPNAVLYNVFKYQSRQGTHNKRLLRKAKEQNGWMPWVTPFNFFDPYDFRLLRMHHELHRFALIITWSLPMVWFMIFLYLEDPGRCVFAALFYQHLTCKHFPRKHMQTYACEADAGGRRPKWTQGTSRGTVEKATTFTWFRNGNILGTFEVQVLHLSMHLPELRPQHLFCKLQQTHNAQDRSSQMPCPHGPTTSYNCTSNISLSQPQALVQTTSGWLEGSAR